MVLVCLMAVEVYPILIADCFLTVAAAVIVGFHYHLIYHQSFA